MKSQISFQELINKYKIHDENNIKGFFGDYRFLSNFHLCDVYFEGILYPSSEHAYMASKSLDISIRKMFMKIPDENQKHWGMKCADARKVGQTIELRPDWDNAPHHPRQPEAGVANTKDL